MLFMTIVTMTIVILTYDSHDHHGHEPDHHHGRLVNIDQVPLELDNQSRRSFGTGDS